MKRIILALALVLASLGVAAPSPAATAPVQGHASVRNVGTVPFGVKWTSATSPSYNEVLQPGWKTAKANVWSVYANSNSHPTGLCVHTRVTAPSWFPGYGQTVSTGLIAGAEGDFLLEDGVSYDVFQTVGVC